MRLTKFQRNIILASIIIAGAMYLMSTSEQVQVGQACQPQLSTCTGHGDCCSGLICVSTSSGNMCLTEETYVLIGTGE